MQMGQKKSQQAKKTNKKIKYGKPQSSVLAHSGFEEEPRGPRGTVLGMKNNFQRRIRTSAGKNPPDGKFLLPRRQFSSPRRRLRPISPPPPTCVAAAEEAASGTLLAFRRRWSRTPGPRAPFLLFPGGDSDMVGQNHLNLYRYLPLVNEKSQDRAGAVQVGGQIGLCVCALVGCGSGSGCADLKFN